MNLHDEIAYYKERKCVYEDCYNIRERGYIYCISHLHGLPPRIPGHIVEILKKEAEKSE